MIRCGCQTKSMFGGFVYDMIPYWRGNWKLKAMYMVH